MKRIIHTFLLVLLTLHLSAQNYFEKFQKHFQTGDTIKQKEILNKWEKDSPKDAELYTSLFNYYFNISRSEILLLTSGKPPKGEETIILKDSTNKIAGFIGSKINYDKSNLKKAFNSIETGITLYPNRLDMRFGKIYVLGQIKDWGSFTDEIIRTINYSEKNKNQWTSTLNKKRNRKIKITVPHTPQKFA